jgi:hypothetical protein
MPPRLLSIQRAMWVRQIVYRDAVRLGLADRAATEVARYAVNLWSQGGSASNAILRGKEYARVRSTGGQWPRGGSL